LAGVEPTLPITQGANTTHLGLRQPCALSGSRCIALHTTVLTHGIRLGWRAGSGVGRLLCGDALLDQGGSQAQQQLRLLPLHVQSPCLQLRLQIQDPVPVPATHSTRTRGTHVKHSDFTAMQPRRGVTISRVNRVPGTCLSSRSASASTSALNSSLDST
jgi:hypothetical protein